MNVDLTLSPTALLGARAATEQILDELGLLNYRFDVEPRDATVFDVFIEHERDGAWHTVGIQEPAKRLLAAPTDPALRGEVRECWRSRLFSKSS